MFNKILSGEKTLTHELQILRLKPTLILREWDPKIQDFTGRKIQKKVTYVLKTKEAKFWDEKDIKKHGLQIISFK